MLEHRAKSSFRRTTSTSTLIEAYAEGKSVPNVEGKLGEKLAYEPSSKLALSNRVQPLPTGAGAGSDPDSVTVLKPGLSGDSREVIECDPL